FGIAYDFKTNVTPLLTYLLLPQCWSVGVELSFYLIAPYLNRLRTFDLTLCFVADLSARLLARNYLGLAHDPWSNRFFPFELTWFLAGMLGYRFFDRFAARWNLAPLVKNKWRYLAAAVLLLFAFHAHALVVHGLAQA